MPAPKLDDDRALRRDLTCVATGLLAGGGLGVAAAAFIAVPVGWIALAVAGALVGGLIGRATARRISADDWDPPANRRPYVGANSPDDDVASAS